MDIFKITGTRVIKRL